MAPLIKDASLEAVLAASDIVDVVSGYTSLRKRGSTYTGLCPFHNEKTPSFSVSADKGLFYCFGCGEGGDVVSFVQKIENLPFTEAVEYLGERFSVPVEYRDSAPGDDHRSKERRLQELVEKAAGFYERYLWDSGEGASARSYLEGRGLGEEICREYRLGWAPDDWHRLHHKARRQGFSDQELEEAGLLVRKGGKSYDRFRGRLMFPLLDHRGRVLGFGGRVLGNENPKYLNSPEGPLYRKGRLLYGLYQARRAVGETNEVIVVEGYTDVLALAQAGVRNVVASMGTALTQQQLQLIARFTENVTFMFDSDRAGTEAAVRSGELGREVGLRPMVAPLPSGLDPADAVNQGGADSVKRLVASKISLLGFEVRKALDEGDVGSREGRVRTFEVIRSILARSTSPKETEEEMAVIADRLQLSPDNVRLLLREAGTSGAGGVSAGSAPPADRSRVSGAAERLLYRDAILEREFLAAAVAHPEIAGRLLDKLTPEHFTDRVHREVFGSLREVLESDDPQAKVRSLASGENEAGKLFVRLALETDVKRHSPTVLRELNFRLQERHLARSIARLRSQLERDELDAEGERRLVNLERLHQQVRGVLADLEEE
ncbi:MAG: DNA primase [Thermoleophilia bacterium]